MGPLSIGISGSGTAGQAAAILLARSGHRVALFERSTSLGPIGAGLLVQPSGLAVLDQIGVGDELRSLAAKIDRLLGTTPRGRVVLDIAYRHLRTDLLGLGLQRSAISAALDRTARSVGVQVHLDSEIEHISPDKRSFVDIHKDTHGPFDVLVAADGARSRLRSSVPIIRRRDVPYRWGALWALCDDPDDTFGGTLRQTYRGTREMLGFLPSGRAALDMPRRVSMFWSVQADRTSDTFDLRSWKERVLSLNKDAAPLLGQIGHADQLIFAPYRDVVLKQPYIDRLVFIGDAAHAMSPQLGQGVNLALLDASALAAAIDACDSVENAYRSFDQIRHKNIAFYQRASRWLTPLFQSSHEAIAIPRDVFMGSMCRTSPFRRQALLSLSGVKTGMFTSAPLPPERLRGTSTLQSQSASCGV